MTTPASESMPSRVFGFRHAQWNAQWLLVGLLFLLLWRGIPFIDGQWLRPFPSWLIVLAPHTFFLIFPILTRRRIHPSPLEAPGPTRWLKEIGIAVLITIGILVLLAAANYLVDRLFPGTSLGSDFLKNISETPDRTFVYFLLLFSFTVAPVAEEVFFRGFLHNAFRARVPLLVAAFGQSCIFGFSHFFGIVHACVAFVIGLFLTIVYEWRKTLITPILVHVGINLTAALAAISMMLSQANAPFMGVVGDPRDRVCVIRQIAPNSPAETAGLQVGDIITMVHTEPVRDFPHLVATVRLYRPGDVIPLTVYRSGHVLKLSVILRRRGAL